MKIHPTNHRCERLKTKEYLSRYLELEEIIGIENKFENPLKDYPEVTYYEQVNQAAEIIREKWSLGKGNEKK